MMLIKLHDDLFTPAVPMKNEPVALAVDPIRNVINAPMFRTAPSKGEREHHLAAFFLRNAHRFNIEISHSTESRHGDVPVAFPVSPPMIYAKYIPT